MPVCVTHIGLSIITLVIMLTTKRFDDGKQHIMQPTPEKRNSDGRPSRQSLLVYGKGMKVFYSFLSSWSVLGPCRARSNLIYRDSSRHSINLPHLHLLTLSTVGIPKAKNIYQKLALGARQTACAVERRSRLGFETDVLINQALLNLTHHLQRPAPPPGTSLVLGMLFR